MEREQFGSRIGFLFAAAGCAIGMGNVWRFPTMTGEYGGAIFLVAYLICLLAIGAPILILELTIGRGARASAIEAYKRLQPQGTHWHWHGWVCMGGCYLLMMYYTAVSGWVLDYCVRFAAGSFTGLSQKEVTAEFGAMLGDPWEMIGFTFVMIWAAFFCLRKDVRHGLERVSKWVMGSLFVLMIFLAVYACTMPGAKEGLNFYLMPDFARATKAGYWEIFAAAMNQSFFTLGLGIASMQIIGSYMGSKRSIPHETLNIIWLDTCAALLAGFIIFPACFSSGVSPTSGPSLIFIVLPNIFTHMHGGRFFGMLFFLFMSFAAFSTLIAVFENLVAFLIDSFKCSRAKAVAINAILMPILSLPCLLGFNVWSSFQIRGMDVLGIEDFILSNWLLPFGALTFLAFCILNQGWGLNAFLAEVNKGDGLKFKNTTWLRIYLFFVLPLLILVIFIKGVL